MNWDLDKVLRATGGRLLCGPSEASFSGIGIDSRTIQAGQLFVAITGDRFDAHQFIPQVVGKGVCGLVVAASRVLTANLDALTGQGVSCIAVADTVRALGALAAYQRQQSKVPVVAITGSNGKTTTRTMTAKVLARRYHTLSTQGNFNNEIGLPLTLFNLTDEHQAAVLELGMNHAGEIDRLGAICRPTIGMITNVAPAHLEFLKNVEGVCRAKAELIAHIAANGHIILNLDDERVAALSATAACKVTFFGLAPDAHVRADLVEETLDGVGFELILPGQRTTVRLKTPGRFMVHNALAAAAAGHLTGLDIDEIKTGLESFETAGGRLQRVHTEGGLDLIDDTYNANPASMTAAIDTFRRHSGPDGGYVVLGDMLELGPRAGELHENVGRYAAQASPIKLYAHGDFAEQIIAGARAQGMAARDLLAGSKEQITTDLAGRLNSGDWVLIKGSRGMAMETVVAALRLWKKSSGTD